MKPKALKTTLPMQFTVNRADTGYFCSLSQANKLNIDRIEREVDDAAVVATGTPTQQLNGHTFSN
jgi:DNA-binding transcriptional MocR family regulator